MHSPLSGAAEGPTFAGLMKVYAYIFLLVMSIALVPAVAQSQPSEPRMSKQDYIDQYKDVAVREMLVNGIPASITLAQGLLESSFGNSPLAKYANNHFGIKCHKGWEGPTFIQDDDEKNECFRKYYSADESYKDHSEFLKTRDRYAFLFELKQTDYKGWAHGLKKAGYATNPKYAHLLINLIDEHGLHELDKVKKLQETKAEVALAPAVEAQRPDPVRTLSNRAVQVSDNDIKYVLAKAGDTPESVAKAQQMGLWQICKYNDLDKDDMLRPGDIIYLQPKRNNAKTEVHLVEKGETLRIISQKYGIKMKRIIKINKLPKDYQPNAGDRLALRKISDFQSTLTGR